MRIACFDLSGSNTGWAAWSPGQDQPDSGSRRLCDNKSQAAAACIALHKLMAELHRENPIDLIVREAPILLRTDTVSGLMLNMGLASHCDSYAKVKGILYDDVAIDTWRATFLGADRQGVKGEALKQLSVERCRQYGLNPSTHDEAEAIGVLHHVMLKRKIVPPWERERFLVPSLV